MDLGAFAQVDELSPIAIRNGIDIPRLRGYRLMTKEGRVSEDTIELIKEERSIFVLESLCTSEPFWNPNGSVHTFSENSDKYIKHFCRGAFYGDFSEIRWDRIHGKKRRILKFELKKMKRHVDKNFETYNKYLYQPGILMIHARIGGDNWNYFGGPELEKQPWFIERVDDCCDSTYCDIYARIDSRYMDHLKDQYMNSGVVMTEFLRSFNPELPNDICKELLKWSGEEEYEE